MLGVIVIGATTPNFKCPGRILELIQQLLPLKVGSFDLGARKRGSLAQYALNGWHEANNWSQIDVFKQIPMK